MLKYKLRNEEKPVKATLCGKEIVVFSGTLRKRVDQDDAWYYHLSGKYSRIYDIGCNIGYTAILANISNPRLEKILLVDPNPEALSKAARNLIFNNMASRANFIAAFVDENSGNKIPFYTIGTGEAGSKFKGHAVSASSIGSKIMVPTTTVDDIYKQIGWPPDLIKIDVEGAESMVLNGAVEVARSYNPLFMVEMHSPPELPMKENGERILRWCRDYGYRAWYLKEHIQLDSVEPFKNRGKCHLLLVPDSKSYPEGLKVINQGAALPC